MNPRERRLLLWVLGLAGGAFYVLVVLDPALEALDSARTQRKGTAETLAQVRRNHDATKALEHRLKQIRLDLSTRDGAQVADGLIRELDKELKGLKRDNLAQSPDVRRRGEFIRHNISFDTEGSLQQVCRLVHALTFWEEYYRLEGLAIIDDGDKMRCRVPGSALVLTKPVEVDPGHKIDLFSKTPDFDAYKALVDHDMFSPYVPPPPPPPPRAEGPRPAPPPARKRDSADVYLSGIQADPQGGYFALLQDAKDSRKFQFLRPGERFLIYEVKEVTADAVVLVHKQEIVTVPFGEKTTVYSEE